MANKRIPLRQCVGCAQMKAKNELIRVIKTPEDEVVLDTTGRKNGRGAYICQDPECLARARKTKGVERSLEIAIPDEVYDFLEKEMSELGR